MSLPISTRPGQNAGPPTRSYTRARLSTAYRPKRSGSTRAGRGRRRRCGTGRSTTISVGRPICRMQRITRSTTRMYRRRCRLGVRRIRGSTTGGGCRRGWDRLRQMRGGCSTCTATSRSGLVRITGLIRRPTTAERVDARWFVGVLGWIDPRARGRRFVCTTRRRTRCMTWGSASFVRTDARGEKCGTAALSRMPGLGVEVRENLGTVELLR